MGWTTCSAASSLSARHLQSSTALLSGSYSRSASKTFELRWKNVLLKKDYGEFTQGWMSARHKEDIFQLQLDSDSIYAHI